MVQFKEVLRKDGQREFALLEDGISKGTGSLSLRGKNIYLKVKSGCESEEFIFRALLNVCRTIKGFTVYIDSELAEKFYCVMHFTKSQEKYIIKTDDIVFRCRCEK